MRVWAPALHQLIYNVIIEAVQRSQAYQCIMDFGEQKMNTTRGGGMVFKPEHDPDAALDASCFDDLLWQLKMDDAKPE